MYTATYVARCTETCTREKIQHKKCQSVGRLGSYEERFKESCRKSPECAHDPNVKTGKKEEEEASERNKDNRKERDRESKRRRYFWAILSR